MQAYKRVLTTLHNYSCLLLKLIKLNPLGPIAPNVVIILSASSCDFRQCPWEIGSATAEGQDGGRWVGAPGGCKQHGRVWALQ